MTFERKHNIVKHFRGILIRKFETFMARHVRAVCPGDGKGQERVSLIVSIYYVQLCLAVHRQ